jgi:hypothetical protein
MNVFITLLGAGLVLVALRDIFHQLFHPSGSGVMSRYVMHGLWRAFRRTADRYPGVLVLAGPFILLSVIMSWCVLLALGWALIIWPWLPEAFLLSTGLDSANNVGFVDALYVSLVTLVTLGYGDITPTAGWLRLLLPLEALIGFALLTAGLSWILSVYPVLSRRRSLAQEVTLLRRSETELGTGLERISPDTAAQTLSNLASQLTAVRGDLMQFPVTYYFHTNDDRSKLSASVQYLKRLAEKGCEESLPPEVRLHSAMLHGAIEDFAETLGTRFLNPHSAPTDKVLAAYTRDQLRSPEESRAPEEE